MLASHKEQTEIPAATAFDLWAPVYDAQINPLIALEERYLDRVLPCVNGRDILDAGCGTGRWLYRLQKQGSPRSLFGVDSSNEMLKVAAEKCLPGASFISADLLNIPLATESIDLAVCSFVLDYVSEFDGWVKEQVRLLRDDGDLFITDMHPKTAALLNWKRGYQDSQSFTSLPHCRRPLKEIATVLERNGLELVALYEPLFGSAERLLFACQNKVKAYRDAKDLPAIYILHLRKSMSKSSPCSLVLRNGRFSVGFDESIDSDIAIRGNRISAIRPCDGATRVTEMVDLSDYMVFPGLINGHDHLDFALFPRLGHPPYRNASEWALDIQEHCKEQIERHKQVPREVRLWWGAIRNLLSGVTTVCHHDPAHLVFNDPRFPVRIVSEFGWAHSLRFGKDLQFAHSQTCRSKPFILHACEGIDSAAKSEFQQLNQSGLLDDRLVLVHGVGLTHDDALLLKKHGGALTICPTSNVFLFGKAPSNDVVLAVDKLAIGSDSSLTAHGDLLDEIRFCNEQMKLEPAQIYSSVTHGAAELLRLPYSEGLLSPTSPADLFAVRSSCVSPAEQLTRISWRDVELVIVRGEVRLASTQMLTRLSCGLIHKLQPISVDGIERWIDAPIRRIHESAFEVLGSNNIFLNGRSVCLGEAKHYVQ